MTNDDNQIETCVSFGERAKRLSQMTVCRAVDCHHVRIETMSAELSTDGDLVR